MDGLVTSNMRTKEACPSALWCVTSDSKFSSRIPSARFHELILSAAVLPIFFAGTCTVVELLGVDVWLIPCNVMLGIHLSNVHDVTTKALRVGEAEGGRTRREGWGEGEGKKYQLKIGTLV